MNQDWDIKPRSRVCQKCQADFVDHQPYFTWLSFTPEGYQRMDCCEPCSRSLPNDGSRHSSWKGIFKMPPPEPEKTIRRETAETLLRNLVANEATSSANVIYILAVMLERQRVLVEKEVRQREDGARILVYEHRKTGEAFLVRDPQLRLDQLDPVQAEVSAMLAPALPRGR